MGIGTPGFEGARLKEAREARDFTAASLAELIGKTPQAIYKYERNEASPTPHALDTIARVLNMPLSFFTLPERKVEANPVFYRSMASTTKRARIRAHWKLEWVQDIVAYLSNYIEFPSLNLPDLGLSADSLLIPDDEIESAAEDARRYWRMSDLSPIGNMVALAENQGVIVARQPFGAATLDSLSMFGARDGRPYIVVGTDKGSAVRWRFDVAHELGHLLLHADIEKRQLATPEHHKRIEDQAHRFARAFLLPLESFGEDFIAPHLDVLRAMKPKWKVSIAAMIMRARDMELLNEHTERNLWISLSRRGWRREEPYDNEIQAEEPRLIRQAIELLMDSGAQTVEDLLANLCLSVSDIEDLAGLPMGYLRNDFYQVRIVQSRTPKDRVAKTSDQLPGDVVRLPLRKRDAE